LVIVVEDYDGNKFGGYIDAKIDKTDTRGLWQSWETEAIYDPNAFVFSLKSNGRINGMMKFGIKDKTKAFILNDSNNDWLFLIGKNKGWL
jgi:hypothetical protein